MWLVSRLFLEFRCTFLSASNQTKSIDSQKPWPHNCPLFWAHQIKPNRPNPILIAMIFPGVCRRSLDTDCIDFFRCVPEITRYWLHWFPQVCAGDHVIVDLQNGLMEESSSIHWHGHHQVDSPYMDGVPHLTQCPVPPRTTFRYRFQADSPGTHFWHSHTGEREKHSYLWTFSVSTVLGNHIFKIWFLS